MATQKIRIKLEAYDHRILDVSCGKIIDAVRKTDAQISGPIPLPTKIEKYTVLRSPHIDKRSREQFEIRTHRRLIEILNPSAKTVDMLGSLELPAGVHVRIKA